MAALTGSDANPGTQALPLKTLTAALSASAAGDTVHVAPGTYDAANGEAFPLVVPAGVTVEGDVPSRGDGMVATLVKGAGAVVNGFSTHAAIVPGEGVVVRGLKVSAGSSAYAYAGIVIADVTVEVAECTVSAESYVGVSLGGTGASTVHHCTLDGSSYGVYFYAPSGSVAVHDCAFGAPIFAIDLVGANLATVQDNLFASGASVGIQVQSSTAQLLGNTFTYAGYSTAAIVITGSKPVLRGNSFSTNLGVKLTASGDADLGTVGSPGLNSFAAVTGFAVEHEGPATIQAEGNVWQHAPPTAGLDILVTGAGTVVYGPGAGDKVP